MCYTLMVLFVASVGCVVAAPAPQAVFAAPAVAAPAVAAPVVAAPAVITTTSSQYIARNYNGVVAAPVVAVPDLPYTYPAVEPVYYI